MRGDESTGKDGRGRKDGRTGKERLSGKREWRRRWHRESDRKGIKGDVRRGKGWKEMKRNNVRDM